ncbi:MAG: hypothetical protein QOC56_1303 [Alphaproteobacteria bacterium]|jgi:hypothetical protein|nr:hypothetical protein [Alphaproteobacteria bacterium]MEA2937799.1 hypothetical protein [Alphaproteobacteria bacterium]
MALLPKSRSDEFPRTGHVIVAFILSVGLWAFMVFVTLAYLRRVAGGLEPFDLRPFGYDVEEARALLAALSQIGRDYYANVQLQFDTAYPALYALSRGLLLLWLTAAGRTSNRPLPVPVRLALLALPTATAAFDYLENDGIAAMLAAGPQAAAELVARTSFWTQAKSLAGLATEVTCVILLAVGFVRWWHARHAGG